MNSVIDDRSSLDELVKCGSLYEGIELEADACVDGKREGSFGQVIYGSGAAAGREQNRQLQALVFQDTGCFQIQVPPLLVYAAPLAVAPVQCHCVHTSYRLCLFAAPEAVLSISTGPGRLRYDGNNWLRFQNVHQDSMSKTKLFSCNGLQIRNHYLFFNSIVKTKLGYIFRRQKKRKLDFLN